VEAREKTASNPDQPLRQFVIESRGRQAYGVYVFDKKVGWLVEEIGLGKHKGEKVCVYCRELHFVMKFSDQESTLDHHSTTYSSLRDDGRIVFAEDRTVEDGVERVIRAVESGDQLEITLDTGEQTAVRRVPQSKATLDAARRFSQWLKSTPPEGDTFTTYSIDLEEANVDVEEVNTFVEKGSMVWGGVPIDVYRVRVSVMGVEAAGTLTETGRILKGRVAGVFDLRAEEEAVAKNLETADIDMLAASVIPVEQKIADRRKIDALTLEITGLGDFTVPSSPRQRVRAAEEKGAVTVELARDQRWENPIPLSPESRAKNLESTPVLQSGHPTIRQLAREITGGEKDPVKTAELLQKWVFDNLRKAYNVNATLALTVLDNRAGDCTEHALLFVALARAAGVPARRVGGLVYCSGGEPFFAWHEWAEIHDGSQWVSVDPVEGDVYVDPTHVKLSEGSGDYAWINVLGRLRVRVVSFANANGH
jgi:transglutaminase-like putative cysteine protease